MEDGASPSLDQPLTDENRYRLLVNAVTDYAIYMIGIDGRIASWNAGAQRLKGYREEEILGRHFAAFYTPEDRAADLPARALAIAARDGRFEGEGWRVRKDGTRFWANVVIDPIRDSRDRTIGYAKVTRDLSDKRDTEDALRRSEEQLRLLVQGVTDYSLYMLTPEGRIASWNAGAERIKGYTADEIIGEHFSRFYTAEDRANDLPAIALAAAASVGRFEKEGWRVRKDGTRFWANVVIDAIRSADGTLLGFAKITRDVTERRANQLALEKAREALLQSQKMDALGQLTGGVAHDFNNVLTAVLGSLEIVRKRADDSLLPLIDNAIHGAQRGAALTRRMLAFARRQELSLEPIDIPTLVRDMTDLLESSLGPAIQIETRFPLKLPTVMADTNQLEMAILNLAVNARDAMPNGGTLTISAFKEVVEPTSETTLKPGFYVRLSLADSGEGMDEATLARATEPFYTTKEIGKGTGLGLSMAHGLAEQSGGQLRLTSKKGAGTTVDLWLPSTGTSQTRDRGVATDRSISQGARSLPPLSIVVVDDDPLVLTNMIAMLEDLGHQVFPASSAQEALDILDRQAAIDLVITDYAMPHMTGMELIEALAIARPQIPVILASGFAELPADAVPHRLSKPFLQYDLIRAVHTVMAPRKNATPPR